MSNMLQSSQTQATQAPSFYTDYLSGLATAGQAARQQAQFAGAQPLQTQAFEAVGQNFGTGQQANLTGQGYLGQAAGQNITGATTPYLQAATATSPLTAMQPYAQEAMCTSGYCAAVPLVGQGSGLSGLTAASPFLGRAAGAGGACASAGYVNQATQLSAPSAASGYFQQAAARGGLCAAQPYLQAAATNDPSQMAAAYMSPFKQQAVQSLSDIAQRNIRQNLSPAATAAAVGSGQFGSQRGAQVLGQIQAQAEQDLNSQIAQMLNTGYGQALQAAGQQQALTGQLGQTAGTLGQQQAQLLGQLGSTAGSLTGQQMQNLINAGNVQGTLTQQQQNLLGQLGQTAGGLTNQQAQNLITAGLGLGQQQTAANQIAAGLGQTAAGAQQAANTANIQAAQTAGCAAAKQAAALYQSGLGMGQLGQQAAAMNLACINALATLGGQQQTIAQNQQMFPLTSLSSLAGLLQGYSIPTSTKTTLCMSPLSAAAGLLTSGAGGTSTLNGMVQGAQNLGGLASNAFNWLANKFGGSGTTGSTEYPSVVDTWANDNTFEGVATGGHIQAKADGGIIGCMSTMDGGAIPQGFCAPACMTCTPYAARGGLIGATGCISTTHRGALPYKG